MKNSKPDWYALVKNQPGPAIRFDEAMKAAVMDRIGKRSADKTFIIKRKWKVAAVCLLVIFAGLYASTAGWLQQEHRWQQGAGEEIPLVFTSLEDAAELRIAGERQRRALQRVPLSTVEITAESAFDEIGRYVTYVRLQEDSPPYDGLILEDHSTADTGYVLEYGVGGLTEVQLTRSEAFGEFDYRLTGSCGPSMVCTRWFSLEGDQVISELALHSPAYERDLDGDGVKEIVLAGTPYFRERVYVLKKRNERIEYIDMNDALQVEPPYKLIYDDANQLFQVRVDGEIVEVYRYAEGEDKLLKQVQSDGIHAP
ncbi:hypothetical protein DUZ99_07345 [Xylanibacillus composti]|uniref:Uncharacterized protein n=1 Tax=Xylanibacillus composti TaxID=1572762 RepID=A0A8J4H2T9_9BACL|nr:hypothetical protein [Xylanibacillus composti]MDT9724808.1 hypothetical protein [Xylanibacillus composti]GIQ69839.1 hypothetical protein XYCOK13_26630 [Xylanibacillus composti]